MQELSRLDLAFCVDLTNSMAPFIHAARRHMSNILRALSGEARADLRVAVVGYRDHGEGMETAHAYPFRQDPAETQRVLDSLVTGGSPANTDAAEAVLAGLLSAVGDLEWRPKSSRVIVLVGDAPPHGCGADAEPHPDRFPKGDPTGKTPTEVAAAIESGLATLYALGMLPSVIPVHDPVTEEAFSRMAQLTGGFYRRARSSEDAMAVVEAIGRRVFGELSFDRRLFEELAVRQVVAPAPGAAPAPMSAAQLDLAMPDLEQKLGASKAEIQASLGRLAKRQIVKDEE
jgi:hypothetical protein